MKTLLRLADVSVLLLVVSRRGRAIHGIPLLEDMLNVEG